MDPYGHIYEIDEEGESTREDVARLEGYLRGRAESEKAAHEEALEQIRRELEEERRVASDRNQA